MGPDALLTRDDDGVFHCGALTMRVLEHNFATVEHGPARPGYAQQSTKHSAVTLRTAGDSFVAKPAQPVRYAVVVAPSDAGTVSDFRRSRQEGEWGFQVKVGGIPLTVSFDPRAQTVSVNGAS